MNSLWKESVTYAKSLRKSVPKFTIIKGKLYSDAQKYYCAAMKASEKNVSKKKRKSRRS